MKGLYLAVVPPLLALRFQDISDQHLTFQDMSGWIPDLEFERTQSVTLGAPRSSSGGGSSGSSRLLQFKRGHTNFVLKVSRAHFCPSRTCLSGAWSEK
eukprot:609884-Pelagomonas_calceolata.AAC.7